MKFTIYPYNHSLGNAQLESWWENKTASKKIVVEILSLDFEIFQISPLNLKFLVKPATGIRSIEVYYKNPLLPDNHEKKLSKIRKGEFQFLFQFWHIKHASSLIAIIKKVYIHVFIC